ncbi:MAG: leucine-rich repeat domain-containing protein [Clostridia bacterium]|nr:leucine-rich repeat domain-containing protein [Clostridia bacterium]
MKKKLLCLIIAALVCIAGMTAYASPADEFVDYESAGAVYRFHVPTGTIMSLSISGEYEKIPDTIENAKVTAIFEDSVSGERVTRIDVPSGVVTIGDSAFTRCKNLETVNISEGTKTIGECAFQGCQNLREVNLPQSVEEIGDGAFRDCRAIESITLPSKLKSLNSAVFSECQSLKEIVIPDSVQSIGDWAFADCTSLKSIAIGSGVTDIYEFAFMYCTALESVSLPAGLETVYECAFADCTALDVIYFAGTRDEWNSIVIEYDNDPLSDDKVVFTAEPLPPEDAVRYAVEGGSVVFNPETGTIVSADKSITGAVIPESIGKTKVSAIGGMAFADCKRLKSVSLPKTIKTIGSSAFRSCESLESVYMPDGIISIGSGAFTNCCALKSAAIPSGVTKISESLFYNCNSLETVIIPEGVKEIESSAFKYCQCLSCITLPQGMERIGDNAFEYCPMANQMSVPLTLKSIGRSAFNACYTFNIYYGGNKNEWDAITIGDGNEHLSRMTFHYASQADSRVDESTGKRVTYVLENGAVTVSGDVSPSAPVYVASYDERGRMKSAGILTAAGAAEVSGAFAKMIWVDADGAVPKTQCAVFRLK